MLSIWTNNCFITVVNDINNRIILELFYLLFIRKCDQKHLTTLTVITSSGLHWNWQNILSNKCNSKNGWNILDSFFIFFLFLGGQLVVKNRNVEKWLIKTWGQFHQHFTSSFYVCRSRKRKKRQSIHVAIWASGIARIKAEHKQVDEIDWDRMFRLLRSWLADQLRQFPAEKSQWWSPKLRLRQEECTGTVPKWLTRKKI